MPPYRPTPFSAFITTKFINRFRKGNKDLLLFVDPKGTAYTNYEFKVGGFKKLFSFQNGERKG